MRAGTRVGLAAMAVAASMTLAACSADDGGGSQEGLTYEDSPLFEFLGGDVPFDEDEYAATERQVQEAVAECMADEGFEYVPSVPGLSFSMEDVEERDTEEWIAEHGFGITTFDESLGEDEDEDPNAEYVESLSPGEQEAYAETLYGPTPSDDELAEDGAYEYDWETAGCVGAADHEVRGDPTASIDEHQEVLDAMVALYEEVEASPDLVDLDADWSACMADAGHADLERPTAAWERALEAANALWGDGESEPADEALADAREAEIDLALADFRCRDELGYDDERLTVQFALEEQFIEDHRAELEAYRASIEQGA